MMHVENYTLNFCLLRLFFISLGKPFSIIIKMTNNWTTLNRRKLDYISVSVMFIIVFLDAEKSAAAC